MESRGRRVVRERYKIGDIVVIEREKSGLEDSFIARIIELSNYNYFGRNGGTEKIYLLDYNDCMGFAKENLRRANRRERFIYKMKGPGRCDENNS